MTQLSLLRELWAFMRIRKKWWLLPLAIILLLVASQLVFAQSSTSLIPIASFPASIARRNCLSSDIRIVRITSNLQPGLQKTFTMCRIGDSKAPIGS